MSNSTLKQRMEIPETPVPKQQINDSYRPKQQSNPRSWKENLKTLGLIALILLLIYIGAQMTDPGKRQIIITNQISVSSAHKPDVPSSDQSLTQITVHEDDSDVEIDVPQKLPNISTSANESNQTYPYTNVHDYMIDRANGKNPSKPPPKPKTKPKPKPRAKGKRKIKSLINFNQEYHDPKEENIILPSIEQMEKNASRRFYNNFSAPAQIFGYEDQCMDGQCQKAKRKYTVISGLYNTGTNVAFKMILPNCMTQMKFQPHWGKHEMITSQKFEYWNAHDVPGHEGLFPMEMYSKLSMMVVVVKDPLTWMKSMCKANYDFRYFNRSWFFDSCPKGMKHSEFDWMPMNRGRVRNQGKNKTSNGIFKSPAYLWSEWYGSLVNTIDKKKWPYLIVRYEDLLFRIDSVLRQLCSCLGKCKLNKKVDKNGIKISEEKSKPHGHARNRTMSFWRYSSPEYRYEGYSKEDLEFMLDAIDPELLELFGYEFDVERTKRMRL